MKKLGMRVFWNHGPIPVTTRKNARLAMTVPFGVVMNLGGSSGSGGAVDSVNGKTGIVTLGAVDVGADVAGSAQAVSEALQPQITLNAEQLAFLTALLAALQSAKADVTYVNQQIANLVGTDAQMLATIQAIADGLAEYEDLLSALDQTVANRVRFDVATQGLTALQKYNARTNIGAEEAGTAAQLISQITAASIGAVTASQLANVAFSGSYNDLSNKPSITGALLTGLTSVSAAAISATDSIIGALAKLQANVDTKADATNTWALINAKVSSVLLGAPNGVATLGSDGILTAAQRPASSGSGTANDIFGVGMGFQVGKQINEMWYDTCLNTASVITYQMPAANWGITFPVFFRENLTISEIGFYVNTGVTGSNAQIGIYSAHPTHGYPYQKLYGSSNITTASAGGKSQTITSKFTFTKNKVYWIKLYTTHTITVTCSNGVYHPVIGASIFGNNINGPRGNGFSQVGAMAAITPYFSLDSSGDGNSEVPLSIANASFATLTAVPVIAFRAAAP